MECPVKKLILLSLLLTGCPTSMEDCSKMCGERGVLLWQNNNCICQQVQFCREPPREPPKETTK